MLRRRHLFATGMERGRPACSLWRQACLLDVEGGIPASGKGATVPVAVGKWLIIIRQMAAPAGLKARNMTAQGNVLGFPFVKLSPKDADVK